MVGFKVDDEKFKVVNLYVTGVGVTIRAVLQSGLLGGTARANGTRVAGAAKEE